MFQKTKYPKAMKTYLFTLLAFLLLLASGCEKDENRTEKKFDLTGFHAIDLGDAFKLDIRQGSDFEIVAEGRTTDISDLELRVENGVLKGKYLPGHNNRGRTNISITLPRLVTLHLGGATETVLKGFTDGNEDLDLIVEGASELRADIEYRYLYLNVSGASDVEITGTALILETNVSGASDLKAVDLDVPSVIADVSGASDADLYATQSLTGSASGASTIWYSGNPAAIDVAVTGNSHLKKRNP